MGKEKIDTDAISDTVWKWASGGELHLRSGGVADHTIWKKSGRWQLEEDGVLTLFSDTGSRFKVRFEKGIGYVTKVSGGSKTTIEFKRDASEPEDSVRKGPNKPIFEIE
ncbi:MAG: hypothetical protein R3F11_17895 [Verrucomicrobiales bacterium]